MRTGSAGSNGTSHGAPAASTRVQVSRHRTAPLESVFPRPSQAASASHASARSAPPRARQAATTVSRASSPDRFRFAANTPCIVLIVKPRLPSPSVPARRCSAWMSPSRPRSSRGVPSGPMIRGKPFKRTSAFGTQYESLEFST